MGIDILGIDILGIDILALPVGFMEVNEISRGHPENLYFTCAVIYTIITQQLYIE